MTGDDRVEFNTLILMGPSIVRGLRIAVESITDLPGRGWSIEQILGESDHLSRDDLRAGLLNDGEMLAAKRAYLVPG
jgi:uncharacterized protein (DUF433 family)